MYQRFNSIVERESLISADIINNISEYLIAKTETEDELEALVLSQLDDQEARKEAWKLAYKEVPIPMGYIPLETRREIQIRRDELAQKYYEQIRGIN